MRNRAIITLALASSSLVCSCTMRTGEVAVRALAPAGIVNGGSADHYVATGRRLLDEGSFGLALDQFRAALREDSQSAAAENGLAIAYAGLGRSDIAQRHFERAVAFDPANDSYRRNLARLTGIAPEDDAVLALSGDAIETLSGTEPVLSAPTTAIVAIHTLADEAREPTAAPLANGVVAVAPGISLLRTRSGGDAEAGAAQANASGAQPAAGAQAMQATTRLASLFRPVLDRVGLHQFVLHTGLSAADSARTLAVNEAGAKAQQAKPSAGGLLELRSAVTRAQQRLSPEQGWTSGCRVVNRGADSGLALIRVSVTRLNRLFGCSSSS